MLAWMRTACLPQVCKVLGLGFIALTLLSLCGCEGHLIGLLNPKGLIAYEERKLFFDTLALMLIVVIPVIIMSITFIYHYQSSHRIQDYKPNWSHSYLLECLWWGIPCAIIVVLAILTWKASHELDPYAKIPGQHQKIMSVQVIALPWKWLFIYPEQKVASVNYLAMPKGVEVEYTVTADNVPMSAFFIPQLGSQIYAMAGMRTHLHLISNQVGIYEGMNTQFNGDGFSDMHFKAEVMEQKAFDQWVQAIQKNAKPLNMAAYKNLLNPDIASLPQYFSGLEKDLFEQVIMAYMKTYGQTHPRDAQIKFYNSVSGE